MPKPGVMLYFDLRPCLKRLTGEQKGQLFEAILEYGEFGVAPDFDADIGLAVAWDLIRPMIDRDNERYLAQVKKKQYAVYTRECKKNGIDAPDFETWRLMSSGDNERHHVISGDNERHLPMTDDNGCYPITTATPATTTPTPTPTTTTTATTTPTTATTPLSYGEPKNPAMNAVAAGFEDLRRARLEKLNALSGKK